MIKRRLGRVEGFNYEVRFLMASLSSWRTPPYTLSLGEGEVHVWRAFLNEPPARIEQLLQTLSADERERAGRFYFPRDRNHFIITRGVLRTILGGYLNLLPEQIHFQYGRQGKPALAKSYGVDALHFNLTHSHEIALYAITQHREVGIDLEHVRGDLANREIAGQFFSPREVAKLKALPDHLWQEAFFNCWTRKEAYIKARGAGLSLDLKQFEVSLVPGELVALLSDVNAEELSRWSLVELFPGDGYAACLAVEGHDRRIECWQWKSTQER